VTRNLDQLGRRVVVADQRPGSIERLSTEPLRQEVPGVCGDARSPALLGAAGLGHPNCAAVLALTGDEQANLQVVMTCALLNPEVPVIARASTRHTARAMADFSPLGVINPFDDFGAFLSLQLRRPHTWRLITWLTSRRGAPLPALPAPWRDRHAEWLVVADGDFGDQIAHDLRDDGHAVRVVPPGDDIDFSRAGAVVVGAESDATNLALAVRLRRLRPEVFTVVRQQSHAHLPLLAAFQPDAVFHPPRLVAQRAVATIITPRLWEFIESLMDADDAFAQRLTDQLVERLGTGTPVPARLWIDTAHAPAAVRWLSLRTLALGGLFRSPQDWTRPVAAFPLLIVRDQATIRLPGEDTELRVGDEIVMLGTEAGYGEQGECLYDDSTLYYTTTGRDIPTSKAWRWLTRQRWRDAFPADATAGTAPSRR
jgi:Trk K+ transport system NAD-binding subunit